eukprot:TRINITY_DN17091_c0_g1_i1.p2 TRINITY_DN17091_c0_g1~~TRINITY_DN17091_c0_g1_i1.p2  ORF type:complete len:171 (+),score=61.18 TRINITY_DN17091_c0_g1_i1:38-550(+)
MAPRNAEQEKEILEWVFAVLDDAVPEGDFADILKNGVILCKLMNKIAPNSIPKFKEKGPAFLLMENVQSFVTAAKKYGVPDEEVFQTPDLFEARNIPQVVVCLFALGRTTQKHPEYEGPAIGPKMATKNERNFTEEQILAGRNSQISLQAGSNKGASQAGHGGMGNTRHM